MKKLLALGVVSLLIGMTAVTMSGGQERSGNESARERFVGGWRLVSLEQQGKDGKVHKVDCCGLFVFTRDGHMSVQVMRREKEANTPAGPEQYSRGGYEATYGRYAIDESTHTFTIHVEGALVQALIGKDLPRTYEFAGKQLIVKSSDPKEHWRVTWQHY